MKQLGFNRDNQKKQNRGTILQLVATRQCTSRVEIARAMGLTKTAISQIVGTMIEQKLLVETERESDSGVGRSRVGLDISPDAPKYIGVAIQREYCEAVLCDMQLRTIRTERVYREWENREELLDAVYRTVDHMMEGRDDVAAVGVSSIGPVSVQLGQIMSPLFFRGIRNIPIRDLLQERLGLPVYFDQDNQSAVKAEYLYGNGRGYQDILLLTLGRGVGCGILIGGRRVHSATGYNPEIGHICINNRGRKCECGNLGCLETYVNTEALMESFREKSGLDLSYREFCTGRSKESGKVLGEALDLLVSGTVSVLNILNSELVIVGGDLNDWPEEYIRRMEEEINLRKFGNRETTIAVRRPFFGDKMHVLGAASNAIAQTFAGE